MGRREKGKASVMGTLYARSATAARVVVRIAEPEKSRQSQVQERERGYVQLADEANGYFWLQAEVMQACRLSPAEAST